MPQITLEYSNNIEKIDFDAFFHDVHQALGAIAKIPACKSRAIALEDFYVGQGDNTNAVIVFLKVQLLPGRSDEEKQNLGKQLAQIVTQHFETVLAKLQAENQPRIEISELSEHYFFVG